MQDEDTPKFIKLALMGALGYVILPFDFVPDVFAGFGWLDDAAVVAAALRLAGTYVKPEHREKYVICSRSSASICEGWEKELSWTALFL